MKILAEWQLIVKNETRYQSGFQNMVDLAGRISNQFLEDIGAIAMLQVV